MAGAGHIFGVIQTAPLSGLWCANCGYEKLSAFGLADCTMTSPSGRKMSEHASFTTDGATVAAATTTLNMAYNPPSPGGGSVPPSPHPGHSW
jgi:hypothetical protein